MPLCPKCKEEVEVHTMLDQAEENRICDECGEEF